MDSMFTQSKQRQIVAMASIFRVFDVRLISCRWQQGTIQNMLRCFNRHQIENDEHTSVGPLTDISNICAESRVYVSPIRRRMQSVSYPVYFWWFLTLLRHSRTNCLIDLELRHLEKQSESLQDRFEGIADRWMVVNCRHLHRNSALNYLHGP